MSIVLRWYYYKIGETISIKYYENDINNIEYKDIYIDSSIKFNKLDLKHLFDVILEVLLLVVSLIIVMYK